VEGVTLRHTFLCAFVLAVVTTTSAESPAKFVKLDRLCGELSFVTPVSGGGMDSKSLSNVKMNLYPWEQGIACCRKSHPFFTTLTAKEGAFLFKNVDAGRYWLVANYQGESLQLAIEFDPASRNDADAACWQQQFDIDAKRHLTMGIRVEM
jgi:hypothetical protein